jgi:hypothetical protein
VVGEGVVVRTGTGWPRGTLAQVAGGGHLWWDGSRAWQGRQALWRSCAVDLDEIDMGKCREGGRGVVDWPPGRPKPWGLFEIFPFFFFFFDFFFDWEQAFLEAPFWGWVRM